MDDLPAPAVRSRRRGSMLVDAVVSTTILVSFLAGVFTFLGSSIGVARVTTDRARIDAQSTRIVRRMMNDLRQAGSATVSPNTGALGGFSDFLEFQVATGFDTGSAAWSTTTRYEFVRDAAELDDGIDNDGDGMVDEGQVVRRIDFGGVGERTETLAQGVAELLAGELPNGIDDNGNGLIDEPGFVVVFDGTTVTVRLTLVDAGPGGRLLTRTVESSVVPRN